MSCNFCVVASSRLLPMPIRLHLAEFVFNMSRGCKLALQLTQRNHLQFCEDDNQVRSEQGNRASTFNDRVQAADCRRWLSKILLSNYLVLT